MNEFVLDASYAMSWVIEAERTPATLLQLDAFKNKRTRAIVPAIWPEEISNVLLTVVRSRKITPAQAAFWVESFLVLPIEVKPPSLEETFGEVRRLAQEHSLTAYDASYLHLAMQEEIELATRGKQLTAAARKVGVKLVT